MALSDIRCSLGDLVLDAGTPGSTVAEGDVYDFTAAQGNGGQQLYIVLTFDEAAVTGNGATATISVRASNTHDNTNLTSAVTLGATKALAASEMGLGHRVVLPIPQQLEGTTYRYLQLSLFIPGGTSFSAGEARIELTNAVPTGRTYYPSGFEVL